MNIHAIGWGILALVISLMLLGLWGVKSNAKPEEARFGIWFLSILIGLAVTLITW
jgi:quinol-cytochrome oxidoreductase complex cytochrome b subunit